MTVRQACIRTVLSPSLFMSHLNNVLLSGDLSDFRPYARVSNSFDIHDLGHVWVYMSLYITGKKFLTLTLPLCDALWHFLLSFIKNKPVKLVSWPISGLSVWREKNIVLCMAEEITGVDGKKRHFGLLSSNLSSCLYRRVGIMVLFRTNFQLFCTRFHFSVWNAFAVCQVLGSNHFCSNIVSKMSGHFSESLW